MYYLAISEGDHLRKRLPWPIVTGSCLGQTEQQRTMLTKDLPACLPVNWTTNT